MPQDGSNNYHYPPGTPGVPDQTIQSEAYNTFLDDLVNNDLNIPRPISRGGTGASDATQALINLGGEKSSQAVTNYDTQVFVSGSFYSAAGATNAPIAGHAFVGIAYVSDAPATPPANLNLVIEARDQNDTSVPGKLYIREKKAGVWGPWRSDAAIITGQSPPAGAPDNAMWWDSDNGVLYVNYNDGNSVQWVQAVALPSIDTSLFALKTDYVAKAGDTMTGLLTLAGDPTATLHAATKQYVDGGAGGGGLAAKVNKAGDVMTGVLTVKPATGNSAVAIDNTQALMQSILYFNQAGAPKWILGKQTDDSFILYDAVKTDTVISAPSNGSTVTFQRPIILPGDPTTNLQAATKQYVDAKAPLTRYDLTNVAFVDIAVPTGTRAARITGSLIPSISNSASYLIMQPSLVSGTFIAAGGQFNAYGSYVDSSSTAIGTFNVLATIPGYLLTLQTNNTSAPAVFNATVTLKRADTSTVFTCNSAGFAWSPAGAILNSTIYNYLLGTVSTQLQVLAMRFTTATGTVLKDGSYITVEWL